MDDRREIASNAVISLGFLPISKKMNQLNELLTLVCRIRFKHVS